jgi:hypothetical protein
MRADKANVIIRRQYVGRASNDIGFIKAADGTYQAIISEYDSSQHDKSWLDKVSQRYSANVVHQTAALYGYTVNETEVNGEIHITCNTF